MVNMCFYCKGRDMVQSVATHVVTLEERVIVIKNVPCEECEQCLHIEQAG